MKKRDKLLRERTGDSPPVKMFQFKIPIQTDDPAELLIMGQDWPFRLLGTIGAGKSTAAAKDGKLCISDCCICKDCGDLQCVGTGKCDFSLFENCVECKIAKERKGE